MKTMQTAATLAICLLASCAGHNAQPSPQPSTLDVPPVRAYAESLYPNKQGTVLQGVHEVTSDLTRSFFPKKRFFAIHAVNRKLQALVSRGHYRSIVSLQNDKVAPAGAAVLLKEIPVTDASTAERVVQLYSRLYGPSLITPEIVAFAKKHADAKHSVSDLDAKQIVTVEVAQDELKVTAHFGSRAVIRQIVFGMTKNGVIIKESKEIFRSVYYR